MDKIKETAVNHHNNDLSEPLYYRKNKHLLITQLKAESPKFSFIFSQKYLLNIRTFLLYKPSHHRINIIISTKFCPIFKSVKSGSNNNEMEIMTANIYLTEYYWSINRIFFSFVDVMWEISLYPKTIFHINFKCYNIFSYV